VGPRLLRGRERAGICAARSIADFSDKDAREARRKLVINFWRD
jgi:hypothetical protein